MKTTMAIWRMVKESALQTEGPCRQVRGISQFSVGRSRRSIINVSRIALDDSSFIPSCSCTAVKTDGGPPGSDVAWGPRTAAVRSKIIAMR